MSIKAPHAATAEAFRKREVDVKAAKAQERDEFEKVKAKERRRILAEIEEARKETVRKRAEMEVRQELKAEGIL